MASKNHKSSTLPPGLKYSTQPEEHEGFLSKLRKKFKLKKGKYSTDVPTGDLENISPVSFKKRQSTEFHDAGQWDASQEGSPTKGALRETRSESPGNSKKSFRTQSDRHLAVKVSSKFKHERKHSYPEKEISALKNSQSTAVADSDGVRPKVRAGNEYCRLDYDNRDLPSGKNVGVRPNSNVENKFLAQEDNAIDLDNVDTNLQKPTVPPDLDFIDPGYEKLPERRKSPADSVPSDIQKSPDWDPRYESMNDVKAKMKAKYAITPDNCSAEFDPNYESVAEAKAKLRLDTEMLDSPEEPGYQSIKNVQSKNGTSGAKPSKTYNINQSIESLDEPGYESLNDVKRRVNENNFSKNTDKHDTTKQALNDSEESMPPSNNWQSKKSVSPGEMPQSFTSPLSVSPLSSSGLLGLTEAAVSLAGLATAVSGSWSDLTESASSPGQAAGRGDGEAQNGTLQL